MTLEYEVEEIQDQNSPRLLEDDVLRIKVIKNHNKEEELQIRVIFMANDVASARTFARDRALIEELLDVCRKEGLQEPGIRQYGFPAPCNIDGQTGTLNFYEENGNGKYFVVTHIFLGNT
jgi:hypothetical protein